MAYSNYYAASGLFHGSMSSVMGTQFDILMVGSDPRLLGTVWETVSYTHLTLPTNREV